MKLLNFATLMSENFSALLATFSSLAGVLLGSIFTWRTQKNYFDKQIEWDQKKREIDKLEELTMVYNRLLKVDGEKEVIDYNQGRELEFKTVIYVKEIRPILFEKFHLLHSEIADIAKEIDDVLVKWTVIEEEGYEGESEDIARLYLEMIDKINTCIDMQRVK